MAKDDKSGVVGEKTMQVEAVGLVVTGTRGAGRDDKMENRGEWRWSAWH